MDPLVAWLKKLGLEQYALVFADNGVDLASLRLLTDGDLEKLGVLLGHRRTLLNAIVAREIGEEAALSTAVHEYPPPEQGVSGVAERRQLTVLFCDLVGSTSLAACLDPEELRDVMELYQRTSGEVVARFDGHVAQYLGDGVMVYFGWPRAHEDAAAQAIRAGLEMVEAVGKLNVAAPIRARVGIHTGLVVVGDTGRGDAAVPRAAVGETPNIAARIQGLAEPGSVVVSERTRLLAGGMFECADLGSQSLKGLSEPIRVYRVLGARAGDSRFEASRGEIALTTLVGREEEVELLKRRWQQAADGEGQVVLMSGEPGIGKSRLVQVLREELAIVPHRDLRYQCSPYHLNSALYPVIEQLEVTAGFAREDSSESKLDKLEALLAHNGEQVGEGAQFYAQLLSLPTDRYPPSILSPQKRKEKTLEMLVRQVEALAREIPLLIVFEDTHWIDPTSQELLDLMLPRLQALRVMLLITYRPDYAPTWIGQSNVTSLTLNRLGRRQGAALVIKLTGGKVLPPEVQDQILAHTDGIPLFVEELTKSVLESRLLTDAGDHYTLDTPLPSLAVPTTLRDSLLARLDRLAPIREVAQIGACIGREFSYELLAELSPLRDARLNDALDELTKTGLVFRRGTPPDAVYTFKHALVQDAAYDSLLKSTRQQLHGKIAAALEERFPESRHAQPEILAHHCTAAGLTEQAIDYWRSAGEVALQRLALNEATAHLSKGLELTASLPASSQRDSRELTLRTLLGTAWVARRGWAASEVKDSLTPALKLAKILNHHPSYLPILHGLYVYDLVGGRIAHSLNWVREMEEVAAELNDTELKITGHRIALSSHFFLGNLTEAQRHADLVGELYTLDRGRRIEGLTNVDPLTMRGIWGASCLWMLGYPDQALRLREETDAHARARGHPFGLCFLLTIGSLVFDLRGESKLLLTSAEEAARIGQTVGMPIFSEVLAPMLKGIAWLREGRDSDGMTLLRGALGKWNKLGSQILTPYAKLILAEGLARGGETDAGLSLIDECLVQIERPDWEERVHLSEILRIKGTILRQQAKFDESEQSLRTAIEVARSQNAKSWELRIANTLTRLLVETDRRSEGRDLLSPIYGWFREGIHTKDLTEARELLAGLG